MRGAALLLVCGVASAGTWQLMLSPGPVHESHDSFAGDCDQCHLVFDGVPDARCLACHEGLANKIASGVGFHATVEGSCTDCHVDHQGLTARLTKTEAKTAFSHDLTGFRLHGAHEGVDCATCHTGPLDQMATRCGSCHDDAHQSALGPDCMACHTPTTWVEELKTLEAHALPMGGKHAEQSCSDCHTHGEHLSTDVGCAACHEDTHGGTTTGCESCHEVTGFTPARFDHGPCTCAFPGKHQTVGCLDCHEAFRFTDTPHTCAGCHDSDRPHDAIGPCSQCHSATSWEENRFDHNAQTRFPITGKHAEVSCAQCHSPIRHFGVPGVDASAAIEQFSGLSTSCSACHAEQGQAAHGDFGACESCHEVDGFSPSLFQHASTGFPLTGQHQELPCQACHAEKAKAP